VDVNLGYYRPTPNGPFLEAKKYRGNTPLARTCIYVEIDVGVILLLLKHGAR
jgi:hypothetical protein